MNSPVWKRIAAIAVAVLILLYVGYQVLLQGRSEVRTETAMYGSTWDSMEVDAFAVRQELLLTQQTSGVIHYTVEDGGHVSKGGTVAVLYEGEADVSAQQKIKDLKSEIEQLAQLSKPGETYALNPNSLNRKINETQLDLVGGISQEDWATAEELKKDLLYLLNQRQIVVGEKDNFSDRIMLLQEEMDTLTASVSGSTGSVSAPQAGYFVSTADGFEDALAYEEVLSLTVEDLKKERERQALPEDTVGKLCLNHIWYLVYIVDADKAVEYKSVMDYGSKVYLSLPYEGGSGVPARVAAVNQAELSADAAIVLQCEYLDPSIINFRQETLKVEIRSYAGVMVGLNAVHFADVEETVTDDKGNEKTVTHENVKGVYVDKGGVLEFVQIFSDMTVNGYVICREPNENETLYTDHTVRLYDEVVTEGKDLYDGKVVE